MSLRAGAAFVDLIPRVGRNFESEAEREIDGPLRRIGSRAAGVGSRIATGLATGLAGAVAVGAGAVFAAGQQLDDALDNLQTSTTAQGESLAILEDRFRNVAREARGVNLQQVSDAVAQLYARTGRLDPGLEGLATQLLNLSRVTGQDLNSLIDDSTRLFGDWGVAVDDQGWALDRLYNLSRQTGVGIDFISQRLVQFGGPLRQLGFSFDESAALIARFQQEGVNTELVLGSMRQALGRMARAGEAPAETLRRVMDEIKNAGDAGRANALALELFGARAGPDMAAAIREGRFEVQSLIDTMDDTENSINQTARSTDGWRESLGRLRNRAIIALEPIADRLVGALDDLAVRAEPVVEAIGARLPGAFAAVQRAGERLAPIVADVVNRIVTMWPQIQAAVFPVVQAVVALIEEKWPRIREVIAEVLATVQEIIAGFVELVQTIWRNWGEQITRFVSDTFDAVMRVIDGALNVIRGIIDTVLGLLTGDWSRAWDGVKNIVSGTWNVIGGIIDAAIARVRFIVTVGLDVLKGIFSGAWDAISTRVSGALDGIVGFFTGLPDRLAGAAGDVFGFLRESFRSAVNWIIRGWNGLEFRIPGFDPPGPGPSFGGFTLGLPDVPELHTGGIFHTTAAGGEGLALLEDGEGVFTGDQMRALGQIAGAARGGRTQTIYVTVNNPVAEPASVSLPRAMRRTAAKVGGRT